MSYEQFDRDLGAITTNPRVADRFIYLASRTAESFAYVARGLVAAKHLGSRDQEHVQRVGDLLVRLAAFEREKPPWGSSVPRVLCPTLAGNDGVTPRDASDALNRLERAKNTPQVLGRIAEFAPLAVLAPLFAGLSVEEFRRPYLSQIQELFEIPLTPYLDRELFSFLPAITLNLWVVHAGPPAEEMLARFSQEVPEARIYLLQYLLGPLCEHPLIPRVTGLLGNVLVPPLKTPEPEAAISISRNCERLLDGCKPELAIAVIDFLATHHVVNPGYLMKSLTRRIDRGIATSAETKLFTWLATPSPNGLPLDDRTRGFLLRDLGRLAQRTSPVKQAAGKAHAHFSR